MLGWIGQKNYRTWEIFNINMNSSNFLLWPCLAMRAVSKCRCCQYLCRAGPQCQKCHWHTAREAASELVQKPVSEESVLEDFRKPAKGILSLRHSCIPSANLCQNLPTRWFMVVQTFSLQTFDHIQVCSLCTFCRCSAGWSAVGIQPSASESSS